MRPHEREREQVHDYGPSFFSILTPANRWVLREEGVLWTVHMHLRDNQKVRSVENSHTFRTWARLQNGTPGFLDANRVLICHTLPS